MSLCEHAAPSSDPLHLPDGRHDYQVVAPVLVDHDPAWAGRYSELARVITAAVGEDVEQIDHVGSTAVPGLAAKDVIDIQVTVRTIEVADRWPDALGPFRRRADNCRDHVPPGHGDGPDWIKRYWLSPEPRAHLHVREAGRANQRYALLFRDYLRAHPTAAAAYERAKRALAAQSLCEHPSSSGSLRLTPHKRVPPQQVPPEPRRR